MRVIKANSSNEKPNKNFKNQRETNQTIKNSDFRNNLAKTIERTNNNQHKPSQ